MKRITIVVLLLVVGLMSGYGYEIKGNPDQKLSIAIFASRTSLDLNYEYEGWRYNYLYWYPLRYSMKQEGTYKDTQTGINIRIPWTPSLTLDLNCSHVNGTTEVKENPWESDAVFADQFGYTFGVGIRFYID